MARAFASPPATVPNASGTAHPELWPEAHSVGLVDPATEAFITDLMAKMSLREKVGQMIQGASEAIRPEELREYPLGSVLSGGNSPPLDAKDDAPVEDWIRTTEAFRSVSLEQRPGHVAVPIIYGIDSVHGASNFKGAVAFPHNIGLGAARDPELIEEIGAVTASETAAAGVDWAFGPAVAVPRDDRWGRSYEGYSELPDITREYAAAMVRGLQGAPGETKIQQGKVAASVKHFLADGGTEGGADQGDARISEQDLIAIHAPGYISGIDAGAMTVMASFSSWNGVKMHGNKSLLTDVLKGRLGFEGFVVGDWNAHSQVPGCTGGDCPVAFNAGLDMAMAPYRWKELFENTLKEAENGTIPMTRIDDAVRRILRVKVKLGLFDPARPAIDAAGLATPEHREVARRAVAQSIVLLKNNGNLLPIKPKSRVLVTGSHADDIGLQCGGWTISWQGSGGHNADFPQGISIWSGLKSAVEAAGGSATLSRNGDFTSRPDVAIVVFGEKPYAEHVGDLTQLDFSSGDRRGLDLLKRFKAEGIPTVAVFLSGRPLWVNPELNQSDAFVAAFLPGTEGEGIADVLVAKADGTPNRDFTGRLSFSWPKTPTQFDLNFGQPGYDPLFAYGYGLHYGDRVTVPPLDETPAPPPTLNIANYYAPGKVLPPWTLNAKGDVIADVVDSDTLQEGARRYTFTGHGRVTITGPSVDLEASAGQSLRVDYRLDQKPASWVAMKLGDGNAKMIDVTGLIGSGPEGTWQSLAIPLSCFKQEGVDLKQVSTPFAMEAGGPFRISISGIRLDQQPAGLSCPSLVAAK
ncbi:MAG TPA: glycoside hydrolase family 3 N-terminal domain-containing protein [Candidatus Cybelea sp.]|nr:glycoside hydrolase family 3 N-terminal domain-containing protein [Candidatus Cybelea sp.]